MNLDLLGWYTVVAFLAAAIAGGIASVLLLSVHTRGLYLGLASLLIAAAIANIANGLGLLYQAHWLFWREVSLAAELVQPAMLIYAGRAFVNPAHRYPDRSTVWRARAIGVVGVVLAISSVAGLSLERKVFDAGQTGIVLASWGRVTYVFIVLGMTMGLAQLELVLRASREPIRHRLKFIVIGLGGVAGYQIYQGSNLLLVPVWQAEYVLVGGIVTAMAMVLIAYGLGRSRLQELLVNAYVSPQALVGSLTFIAIGLYLISVGAVGEWLRRTEQPLGVGLSVVVVFGGLVALAVVAFSKTVRAEVWRFVARNFYRSKYDYRAQWLEVTKAFQDSATREEILDRLLDLLIKTFTTKALSIWSFREADKRFFRIRSMTTDSEPTPVEPSHPVVAALICNDEAVFVNESLRTGNPDLSGDPLMGTDVALCFPIRAQGKLTAFVALGRQLHGDPYDTGDCDLLRGIAHHVGVLLSHADLAEERQASAELEALHRFSVFCLHDLKNLAARLSLVAQNAESHGRDPAFQESAIRTVTDTAKKMTALMSKLSLKSFKPGLVGAPESVELSTMVDDIIAPIRGEPSVHLHVTGGPVHAITAVKEQIHQVLLNVILNAQQAINQTGDISIDFSETSEFVTVMVEDTGSGIPPAMIKTLFRPSQSSRPGGLGVGLYQCKQIVEAHHGTIQLRSELGKGTQVTIVLPRASTPGKHGNDAIAHTAVTS